MLDILKNKGYAIKDPWDALTLFEESLAAYAGSKYAICVDSCSNALFLCMKYLNVRNYTITLPKHTYASVPMQCIHAGNSVRFIDLEWSGEYPLGSTGIIDAATRFRKGMYTPNSFYCISFHHRKTLKIGRGGAILTDDPKFANWCRPMIYDGRHKDIMYNNDTLSCIGYHMYMTPEDAARGLLLMDTVNDVNPDTGSSSTYTDLSQQSVFANYIK